MMKDQAKAQNAEYRKINSNVQRIALQPARRIGRGNPNPPIQQSPIQQGVNVVNNAVATLGAQQERQAAQALAMPQILMAQEPIIQAPPAQLSKVANLYELWQEYEFGIGGNKGAKYFTSYERGKVKHKYTRRKVIWDCIQRQINRGLQYNVAIDRIYQVYGQEKSVTKIINEMRKDKKEGSLHVSLR